MTDQLIKALAFGDEVRAYVVRATDMVEEARLKQDTWHTATAALGRALIGTTLLATSGLKNDNDQLSVRIAGDGPIGYILATSNRVGETKGYIKNPHVALELNDLGKLDVRKAVGTEGTLSVVKDLGLKSPFSGQVKLISGELAEDFTYYLAASEQTPSAVGLSVLVNPDETVQSAGGFLLQVLPHASEETIQKLENVLTKVTHLSQWFQDEISTEEILKKLVGNDYQVIEKIPVRWFCDCSKERFANALLTLPAEEIVEMIEEDGQAEAVCHFCGKTYHFSKEELSELLTQIRNK
ncbi:Hsp33 family molecular chaperone HslO [Allofustis seminis]|uniref:Hsp33 family molecular chaperone HslO n=1 Tax=Allofustis seminis TaxID=166939 RepID=UPI00036A5C1E|nr:Hsp33 family molecular chaperone HslO [Allofustis seminis]